MQGLSWVRGGGRDDSAGTAQAAALWDRDYDRTTLAPMMNTSSRSGRKKKQSRKGTRLFLPASCRRGACSERLF